MTNYLDRNTEGTENTQRAQRERRASPLAAYRLRITAYRSLLTDYRFLLLLIPLLYLLTLARTPVLGDPTEYTFIAHVLGIAHPPGYAFMTVVGKLFQSIIPFGTAAWRMHLLAAVSGTLAAWFVYGTLRALDLTGRKDLSSLVAFFAALTVGTAVNHWQHSIHANPHILTATFTAANLYFLTKWWAAQPASNGQKWLYLFSFSAGLGVTHHPLTVFGFPAYALFILTVWRQQAIANPSTGSGQVRQSFDRFRTGLSIITRHSSIVTMLAYALLGLAVWLYFPLRSPHVPFGPTTMNTLNGFLDHVLARGLSESLPYFTLAEQPQRLLVFWSILRLQYSLPVIALALFGLLSPLLTRHSSLVTRHSSLPTPHSSLVTRHSSLVTRQSPIVNRQSSIVNLYALTFLSFYAFVISLRAQDIMAYLLGPLLIVGLLAGVGLTQLLALLQRRVGRDQRPLWLLTAVLFLLGPALQMARNAPRISLAAYSEGADYIQATFDQFVGSGQQATLLNDWEHMTPLWYSQFVDGRWPDPADVTPTLVSAAKPWLEFVFDYLPGGPVYLSNYRRDVVDFGFRLRPEGAFYKVIDAHDPDRYRLPAHLTPLSAGGEALELVGYGWEDTAVTAGDYARR
ncbi:MAG: DUF2723 domain-containing protein, partial [Anaerolinea sp.]|nr:DUF2723 domain-containing protein [Anaerolinea sp.]